MIDPLNVQIITPTSKYVLSQSEFALNVNRSSHLFFRSKDVQRPLHTVT